MHIAANSTARFGVYMARTASAFRQSDVTRAIKAAQHAGMGVTRVEIGKDGAIVLVAADAGPDDGKDLEGFRREHGYS